jgi:DNA-binding helix-hairpin-helix protein with protein kinase domain
MHVQQHSRTRVTQLHGNHALTLGAWLVNDCSSSLRLQHLHIHLQALPWCTPDTEAATDTTSWHITVLGTEAVSKTLAAVLADDAPSRAAVLHDSSWDAAIRRVRWA